MENTVKGIIDAKIVAADAAGIVYKQMKAKIFDLLESQLSPGPYPEAHKVTDPKLAACKRIAESMITATARDVNNFILDMLGDWEIEVEAGGKLTPEEEVEAIKEQCELEAVLR
jgi:hypothetical protein